MIIWFILLKTAISYQNPYQTLQVGSYHSLSYIYNVYLELVEKLNNTNSSDIMEKIYRYKRAYLEIKVSRIKEKEDGGDNVTLGLLNVSKQCTMAIIIFYLALQFLYSLFMILKVCIQKIYLYLIINIVIFHFLENFFMPINIKLQYMFTFTLSLSIMIFRSYSRKKQVNLNNNYAKFLDEPHNVIINEIDIKSNSLKI